VAMMVLDFGGPRCPVGQALGEAEAVGPAVAPERGDEAAGGAILEEEERSLLAEPPWSSVLSWRRLLPRRVSNADSDAASSDEAMPTIGLR
jgi:hypothetical protein